MVHIFVVVSIYGACRDEKIFAKFVQRRKIESGRAGKGQARDFSYRYLNLNKGTPALSFSFSLSRASRAYLFLILYFPSF